MTMYAYIILIQHRATYVDLYMNLKLKKITVNIGEDENDPIFTITDLLPHLAQEQMERKSGDETIFENTSTTNLTPIPESEARKIWEEYKHNILLDTRDIYQFKSVTQGKVKPSNYFTSGSAAKTRTADFERDAYIYYYCDQDDYERVIGYVDIYTGKVIGGEYSGI